LVISSSLKRHKTDLDELLPLHSQDEPIIDIFLFETLIALAGETFGLSQVIMYFENAIQLLKTKLIELADLEKTAAKFSRS